MISWAHETHSKNAIPRFVIIIFYFIVYSRLYVARLFVLLQLFVYIRYFPFFFQDHVIVAVFAEPDSPLIGLRNLIMPIRASNIHYNDLLHVVIIGDADYLKSKFVNT